MREIFGIVGERKYKSIPKNMSYYSKLLANTHQRP